MLCALVYSPRCQSELCHTTFASTIGLVPVLTRKKFYAGVDVVPLPRSHIGPQKPPLQCGYGSETAFLLIFGHVVTFDL